ADPEQPVRELGEELALVAEVAVDRRGVRAELAADPAHRELGDALGLRDGLRGIEDAFAIEASAALIQRCHGRALLRHGAAPYPDATLKSTALTGALTRGPAGPDRAGPAAA